MQSIEIQHAIIFSHLNHHSSGRRFLDAFSIILRYDSLSSSSLFSTLWFLFLFWMKYFHDSMWEKWIKNEISTCNIRNTTVFEIVGIIRFETCVGNMKEKTDSNINFNKINYILKSRTIVQKNNFLHLFFHSSFFYFFFVLCRLTCGNVSCRIV